MVRPAEGAMRMAELSARSGVPRDTIHFYLKEGLLPRPKKGGKTVAFYGEEHLERLRLIRRLRDEKYLPLAVIRRLLESPAAAGERDVDVLAEVLHILPARDEKSGPAPSPAALSEATERGLLGPRRPAPAPAGAPGDATRDPAVRRVLSIVDEALSLEPGSRALTLADLGACAEDLTRLVSREAEIFFDTVLESADIAGSIAALRAGRGAVARFVTAYRDLMLRRIVEELLLSIQRAPVSVARAAWIPLSAAKADDLGEPARRAALVEAARRDLPGAAERLVWHLFSCGRPEALAELPEGLVRELAPAEAAVVAWGVHDAARGPQTLRALGRAADAAAQMALGRILHAEALIARGLGHRQTGESILEEAVPALHRLVSANPDADPPVARALGWFHRGRLELALPRVLGRAQRGEAAVERALAIADDAELDPFARARLAVNANVALARHRADGAPDEARALLEAALRLDPEGPVREIVRLEGAAIDAAAEPPAAD
jgi:DNA-binding transcriptional MerR regulator/tetratricopeptide (TPR) repeat protein